MPTVVNEFRAGYNYDNSGRESTFLAADVTAQLGIENAPSLGADRRGFPISSSSRRERTGPTTSPMPDGNVDWDASPERLLSQRQHHMGQWGAHAESRWPLDAEHRSRWVRLRCQLPRPIPVPRHVHRQCVHRFPARDAFRRERSRDEPWTAPGPLQRHRALRPGRLAGQPEADAVSRPPLRGRGRMARERPDPRQLPARRWRLSRGGQRDGRGAVATWPSGARSHADGRRGRPTRNTDQHGQEQLQPASGLAWRLDESSKTVLRAASGCSTRPSRSRASATCSRPTSPASSTRPPAAASGTASPAARQTPDLAAFGKQGIDPNLQSPDIYQYNVTLEHELTNYMGLRVSYIGSTMRKLLVDRDYNTLQASTVPFDPENPADYARLPFPLYGYYMDIVSNAGAASTIRPSSSRRVVGATVSPSMSRIRWPTPRAMPRTPATARSARCSSIPTTSKKIAVPIPTSSSTASWRMRRGTFPWAATARTARAWRNGRTPCSEAGGLVDRSGAKRPEPDAVLQRVLHHQPVEYGKAARRPG